MTDDLGHIKPRYLRTIGPAIALAVFVALGISVIADRFLVYTLNQTINRSAEDDARVWVTELVDATPDLRQIVRHERDHLASVDQLLSSARLTGIFRFKLFDPQGRLLIVSDAPEYMAEGGEASDAQTARQVFVTGVSNVSRHDGTQTPNRPEAYAEIYLLAQGSAGDAFGVIEVYIDTTNLTRTLHATFHNLSRVLVFGSVLGFMLPALIYILRGEQVRTRDRELLHLSLYDLLTNTLNRRAFAERAEALFTDRRDIDVGVIFVDLDYFKQMNDDFGHEFGDKALGHVAQVLLGALDPTDVIGRYGGDEFLILLPGASKQRITFVAEQIEQHVTQPFTYKGNTVSPSVSMGAHLSPPGESEERALHAADLALYRAKADGRGRLVQFSSDLEQALLRRRHVEASIRRSLSGHGGFFIEFQPIYGTGGKAVVGFEALLRLRDEYDALIPPREFVPIAEDGGLMNQISAKAMKCVMETANDWPQDIFVAINLSATQFQDGNLPQTVRTLLAQTGFDGSRLDLEVTEGLLSENEQHVSQQLDELRKLGASISLDDFGTGYSSLGYLWQYHFDKLKIDRLFLQGLNIQDDKYAQVIATIVMLGRNLGLKVVAEGVETNEQLDMLASLRCDQYQGALLGRPMSAGAARALVTDPPAPRKSA